MVLKQCECCGSEFDAEPKDPAKRRQERWNRFCSRRCRNLSRPKKAIPPPEFFRRACGLCGVEFDATPKRPQYDGPLVYCAKCRHRGRIEKAKQLFASYKDHRACEICKKGFVLPKRLVRSGKHSGRFCSLACSYRGRRSHGHEFIPSPVGTKRINKQGYVMVFQPNNFDAIRRREANPESRKERDRGWILEHRYVMEQIMGRALHKWESVHHRDGNRQHNDPANLELWIKTQPTGVRLADVAEVYEAELVAARLRIRELEAQFSNRSL